MEKIILLRVGKTPYRSVYTFEKNESFLKFLDRFLEEFELYGMDDIEINNISLDIEGNNDGCYNTWNKNYRVDIFIGGKEIFLVIRTEDDIQQKVSDKVFKFAEFKE